MKYLCIDEIFIIIYNLFMKHLVLGISFPQIKWVQPIIINFLVDELFMNTYIYLYLQVSLLLGFINDSNHKCFVLILTFFCIFCIDLVKTISASTCTFFESVIRYTVYRVIFAPVIFALFHLQIVSPHLESTQTKMWIKIDSLRHRSSPVLNSPADN